MVKLIDVDPKQVELPTGGVSAPIVKAFMQRQKKVCQIDLEELGKDISRVRPVLQTYIKSHELPIKVFARNGNLYLMRLDLDEKNKVIPWSPEDMGEEEDDG